MSAEKIAATRLDALLVLDYVTLFGKPAPSAQTKVDSAFRIAANSPAAQQRRFFASPAAAAHSGYRNILEIREIVRAQPGPAGQHGMRLSPCRVNRGGSRRSGPVLSGVERMVDP